jgi:hypothetical protein
MPKKETWLSDEELTRIRKKLGIKPINGKYIDKGISQYIKQAVQEKLDREGDKE